jgi:hypothetical protein
MDWMLKSGKTHDPAPQRVHPFAKGGLVPIADVALIVASPNATSTLDKATHNVFVRSKAMATSMNNFLLLPFSRYVC